jgi:hypothetical protein
MSEEKKEVDLEENIPFELIIGDAGGVIDNGDVPIRWCASPDFVKELEAKGVVDPHVLIASYHPNGNGEGFVREMDRKLVPLAEIMVYLRFTKAGKCRVHGIILDGYEGREKLYDTYMRKQGGSYESIVSGYSGELYDDITNEVARTSEFVTIPEGVFGKEPSPLIKWYVNLWHNSDRITDECEFRRRFLIAFIFKWMAFIPFVSVWIAARLLITGIPFLAGYFKEVNVLRSFRPYKYPSFYYNLTDGGIDFIKGNFFLFKRTSIDDRSRSTALCSGLAFTPLTLLVVSGIILLAVTPSGFVGFLAILATVIGTIFGALLAWDLVVALIETLIYFDIGDKIGHTIISFLGKIFNLLPNVHSNATKYTMIGILAMIALVIVGVGFKFIVALVGGMVVMSVIMFAFFFLLLMFSNVLLDWMERHSALSKKNNDYGNITELLCPKEENNLRPNYKFIPKKQRTIRLFYRDLKNKVCKPMQS